MNGYPLQKRNFPYLRRLFNWNACKPPFRASPFVFGRKRPLNFPPKRTELFNQFPELLSLPGSWTCFSGPDEIHVHQTRRRREEYISAPHSIAIKSHCAEIGIISPGNGSLRTQDRVQDTSNDLHILNATASIPPRIDFLNFPLAITRSDP